jgi:hypothetical protein
MWGGPEMPSGLWGGYGTRAGAAKRGDPCGACCRRVGLLARRTVRLVGVPHQAVLHLGPQAVDGDARAIRLAEARWAEYRDVVDQLHAVGAAVPITQAPAKVGAYRVLLDGLDRLTALERALGLLPDDLGQLSDQRQLAEAVLAVFVEFDVPDRARTAVVQRLGVGDAVS